MANTIQLRRSATANAVPTTTQLALGEVAINTYDGKLYLKKNNGTDSIVEVVSTADIQTLSNKRITPRVLVQTSTTSPWAWNSDDDEHFTFTALANALTINADAGTPTEGQKALFRFKDNGTARALTWATGASKAFRPIGITIPTTTVVGKITYVGCVYNSSDARWDVIAAAQEA